MAQEQFIYFASDFHLGLYPKSQSLEREKKVVQWLESIKDKAAEVYLLGDIFDFWWEYKRVVPKGYTRFLGKIAELTDCGVKVHFMTGNHDMWINQYLSEEAGMIIHRKPITKIFNKRRFFIAHGDDLGPGDFGYKCLKLLFKNKVLQWFFSWLHPDIGVFIGNNWAKHSRYSKTLKDQFKGEDKERLVLFAKKTLQTTPVDYFIFGHRHIPVELPLDDNTTFINLGDWINHFTYGVFDGNNFQLKSF